MKTSLVLPLVLAAVLSWIFYSQVSAVNGSLREQQKQLRALEEKLTMGANAELLDLQERCASQAQRDFQSLGHKKEDIADYTNHYNSELKKCFILVETNDGTWINKFLSDAYERKAYGVYLWHVDKVKKYWEVPPVECYVMMPSGEKKVCGSSDEFDALVATYMK